VKAGILFSWLGLWLYAWAGMAQSAIPPADGGSLGISGSGCLVPNTWSLLYNPAGLAGVEQTTFGIFYQNYYRIDALGAGAIDCIIPSSWGSFGLSLFSSGYPGLHEDRFNFSYGRKLGTRLRAGIGIHGYRLNQPAGYTDLFAVVPSIGAEIIPVKNLTAGISVFNPAGQSYRPPGYSKLKRTWIASAGYHFGEEVFMMLEIQKTSGEKPNYYGIAEFKFEKSIFLRFAMSHSYVTCYSLGFGCMLKRYTFVIEATRHPVLGYSPAINLMLALE
jgi:hypothetical protein